MVPAASMRWLLTCGRCWRLWRSCCSSNYCAPSCAQLGHQALVPLLHNCWRPRPLPVYILGCCADDVLFRHVVSEGLLLLGKTLVANGSIDVVGQCGQVAQLVLPLLDVDVRPPIMAPPHAGVLGQDVLCLAVAKPEPLPCMQSAAVPSQASATQQAPASDLPAAPHATQRNLTLSRHHLMLQDEQNSTGGRGCTSLVQLATSQVWEVVSLRLHVSGHLRQPC